MPTDLYKFYKLVTLMVDVMFVNRTILLITSGRKLDLVTVEQISNRTEYQHIKSLNKVIKLYVQGGFVLLVILMEIDSKKLDYKLREV